MSRHTYDDGVTPDPRIIPSVSFDKHWVELAPPPKLVGKWYRGETSWEGFRADYRDHLRGAEPARRVTELEELAMIRDVTVVCVEPRGENCHRKELADWCRDRRPNLAVVNV